MKRCATETAAGLDDRHPAIRLLRHRASIVHGERHPSAWTGHRWTLDKVAVTGDETRQRVGRLSHAGPRDAVCDAVDAETEIPAADDGSDAGVDGEALSTRPLATTDHQWRDARRDR